MENKIIPEIERKKEEKERLKAYAENLKKLTEKKKQEGK